MKKLILTLHLLVVVFAFGQVPNHFGQAVDGVIPIKRTNTTAPKKETLQKTNDLDKTTSRTPTGNSKEVGIINGELSVSLTGGALYHVPLDLPKGVNGVKPDIGLSYNSQTGNDIAGYGWSLTGVSKITRIANTPLHNGKIQAPLCEITDQYALDGQRLMIKNGTIGQNSQDGTVYETEKFSNARITARGNTNLIHRGGPEYFMVEYPDGSKAIYLPCKDSKRFEYYLDYLENPNGLKIQYNYLDWEGVKLINFITYGGGNTNDDYRIRFSYEKNRKEEANIGYANLIFRSLLKEIIIEKRKGQGANDYQLLNKYGLSHTTNNLGYHKLTKIERFFGENSNTKLNPTFFTYDIESYDAIEFSNLETNLDLRNINYDNTATLSGDFDGDAQRDFIVYPTNGANANSKYWIYNNIEGNSNIGGFEHNVGRFDAIFPVNWINSLNKLAPKQAWTILNDQAPNNNTTFKTYVLESTCPICLQDEKVYQFPRFNIVTRELDTSNNNSLDIIKISKKFVSGDFDGNGISDVLVIELDQTFEGNNSSVGLSTGEELALDNNEYPIPTFNYAGQAYLVQLDKRLDSNFVSPVGALQLNQNHQIYVDDFNGDGKSDILVVSSGKYRLYTLDENNSLQLINEYDSGVHGFDLYSHPKLFGDYNGDGKTDILVYANESTNVNQYLLYTSTGKSFIREYMTLQVPYPKNAERQLGGIWFNIKEYTNYYLIPTDFNQDGKTDLILAKNWHLTEPNQGFIEITAYKNVIKDNGWLDFVASGTATTGFQQGIQNKAIPIFLNTNRQSSSNQLNFISNNKIFHFNTNKNNRQDHLLRIITTGNGVREVIHYKPLTATIPSGFGNDHYYPTPYTVNYPNYDIVNNPSIQLVTALEKESETSNLRQEFLYAGAVANTQGLGFLGFKAMAKTNWFAPNHTPITTVAKFDLEKRGVMVESFSFLGKIYTDFTNLSPTDYISKTNNTYSLTYLPNKVFQLNLTHNIENNLLNGISKENTYTYTPNYNLLESTTTTTKRGNTIDQLINTQIEYETPSLGNTYRLGLIQKKTSSMTHDGDTKTAQETYTYENGLVKTLQKKGHQTSFISQTNDYDTFGNLIQSSVQTAAAAPRVNRYEYNTTGRLLVKEYDEENLLTQYEYEPVSELLSKVTNPHGLTESYTYNALGNVVTTTDYLGNVTTTEYKPTTDGFFTIKTTATDGSEELTEYDDLGRAVRSYSKNIDDSISEVVTEYDSYGRIVKVSEPYNNGIENPSLFTTTTFDDYGRVKESTAPTGKTTTFSYNGLTVTANDGRKTVETQNNALGQPIQVTDDGGTMTYAYYADGSLKNTTTNGVAIEMEYDGWGNKTKLKDPSAGEYVYTYNDFNELTSETTPNGSTDIEYDDYGNILTKTIAGEATHTVARYQYDPNTKLLHTIRFKDYTHGQTTSYQYTYDQYKRLTQLVEDNMATARFERKYSYDNYGRVALEYYGAKNYANAKESNKWIKNTYKNGEHWQIIDNETNKVVWQTNTVNARGQLTTAQMGNGTIIHNSYDAFGFPKLIEHDVVRNGINRNILKLGQNFNPITGNLDSRSSNLFPTPIRSDNEAIPVLEDPSQQEDYQENFSYDTLDRLTHWTATDKELVFASFYQYPFEVGTNNFSNTEQFQAIAGATIRNIAQELVVTTTAAGTGTQKRVLATASAGTHLVIKAKIDPRNTHKVQITVVEKNTTTAQETSYDLNYTGQSLFETTHQVVNNGATVSIRITKSPSSNDIGTSTTFSIDYLQVLEKQNFSQKYDDKGRIEKNKLGKYNYLDSDPKKIYHNTSLHTTPEADAYYQSKQKQTVSYNVFKSPVAILEQGTDHLSFNYNAFNSRSTMYYGSLQDDQLQRTNRKMYSADGTMEIKYNQVNGTTEFVTYIGGDGYTAPVVLRNNGGGPGALYLYLHRDYQGSIVAITNEYGNRIEKRQFDPWGAIEKVASPYGLVRDYFIELDRGYTGHEHLQSVGLIHMNARLYDPKLHRFLQPDNFVQDPYHSQNYNRYSYVMNNPLKYIDISGETFGDNPYHNNHGEYPGFSTTNQSMLGNGIASLANNWDNLGIKDWANRNFRSRPVVDFFQNIYDSIFKPKQSVAVPKYVAPTPSFSNHQLSNGFQNSKGESNKPVSWSKYLDGFQTALEVVGMAPGIGEFADGLNAVIYLARGDYKNAALSTASMVPLAGNVVTIAKFANKASNAVDAIKLAGKVVKVAKASGKTIVNSARGVKALWKLTDKGASIIKLHSRFGKFYKSSSDGLWWAVDNANHGGSKFKVFKETKNGLEWFKDADEYGNFILNKHKGPTGVNIPWGQLNTIK